MDPWIGELHNVLVTWVHPVTPWLLAATLCGVFLSKLFPQMLRANGHGTIRHFSDSWHVLWWTLLVAGGVALLPLLSTWLVAATNIFHIGGMIPLSDASGYLFGAEHLLDTGSLDQWNCRRPLNATFLAARLLLAGGGFQGALAVQALFFGLAGGLVGVVVARSHGVAIGLLTFIFLLAMATLYLPTTLSETLGATLGSLGFALIWMGSVVRFDRWSFLAGLFFLTLALLARAGVMLILPVFLLYAGQRFRAVSTGGFGWGMMAGAILAVLAGFAFNHLLLELYGLGIRPLGNFSYILYGLAVGGKGWQQAQLDLPQLAGLSEPAANELLYQLALDHIVHEPWLLAKALVVGLVHTLHFGKHLLSVVILGREGSMDPKIRIDALHLAMILIPVLLVRLVQIYRRDRNAPYIQLLLYAMIGVLLSIPIVYQGGGFRLLAPVFPWIGICLALTTAAWGEPDPVVMVPESPAASDGIVPLRRVALGLGVFFLGSALVGPAIGPRIRSHPPILDPTLSSCPSSQQGSVLHFHPGMAMVAMGDRERSALPGVATMDGKDLYLAGDFKIPPETLPSLSGAVFGYDPVRKQGKIYLLTEDIATMPHWGWRMLCSESAGDADLIRTQSPLPVVPDEH